MILDNLFPEVKLCTWIYSRPSWLGKLMGEQCPAPGSWCWSKLWWVWWLNVKCLLPGGLIPPHLILINNMHIPLCHSLYDNCPWRVTLISQQKHYCIVQIFDGGHFWVPRWWIEGFFLLFFFKWGPVCICEKPLKCHSVTENSYSRSKL